MPSYLGLSGKGRKLGQIWVKVKGQKVGQLLVFYIFADISKTKEAINTILGMHILDTNVQLSACRSLPVDL
jgi:hypothetical protein